MRIIMGERISCHIIAVGGFSRGSVEIGGGRPLLSSPHFWVRRFRRCIAIGRMMVG